MTVCKVLDNELSRFCTACPRALLENVYFVYVYTVYGNLWCHFKEGILMLVAICDDERTDRERIGGILGDLIEQYENRFPGYDLIFMDIYLKRINGMETIRKLRDYDRNVTVIFISSSPDHAIESYDVGAGRYLLKPIAGDKVDIVLNRFMESRYPKIKKSLLMVNGSSSRRIAYDDILYIESQRMNLRIVCNNGVEHTIRKKLDEVQTELTQPRFLRCNQSYIVNMDYIIRADKDFTMDNGDRIPIKVRDRKRIRDQYFAYVLAE